MASFKDGYGEWTCQYCKITIKNNRASRQQHEMGNRHKRNVQMFLNNVAKKKRETDRADRESLRELQRVQAIASGTKPPPSSRQGRDYRPREKNTGDDNAEKATATATATTEPNPEEKEDELMNAEECGKAAEEYFRKANPRATEDEAKEFGRVAREFAQKEIDARKTADGESAPMPGQWTTVEHDDDDYDEGETGEAKETDVQTTEHQQSKRRGLDGSGAGGVEDGDEGWRPAAKLRHKDPEEQLPEGEAAPRRPAAERDDDDKEEGNGEEGDEKLEKAAIFRVAATTKTKNFRRRTTQE